MGNNVQLARTQANALSKEVGTYKKPSFFRRLLNKIKRKKINYNY